MYKFIRYLLICFVVSSISCKEEGESPTFFIENQIFMISENATQGEVVGEFIIDVESGLSYDIDITEGNEMEIFSISDNNELIVEKNLLLNFEMQSSFILTVRLKNGVQSDEAVVTINILDGPENFSTLDGVIRFEDVLYVLDEGIFLREADISIDPNTSETQTIYEYNLNLIDGVIVQENNEISISSTSARFIISIEDSGSDVFTPGTFSFGTGENVIAGFLIDGNNNGSLEDIQEDRLTIATDGTIEITDVDDDPSTLDYLIEVNVSISDVDYEGFSKNEDIESNIISGTETTLIFTYSTVFIEQMDEDVPID